MRMNQINWRMVLFNISSALKEHSNWVKEYQKLREDSQRCRRGEDSYSKIQRIYSTVLFKMSSALDVENSEDGENPQGSTSRWQHIMQKRPVTEVNARMTISRCSTSRLSPRQPLNTPDRGTDSARSGVEPSRVLPRGTDTEPAGRPRQPLPSPVTWPLSQHSCQSHYSADPCPVDNYSTPLLTPTSQIDVFNAFHDF